jgi:predicted DNA-binding transcriptional regulator AlpA
MSIPLPGSPQEPCAPLSNSEETSLAQLVLEGYLRRQELAKAFGLSPRTIDRWEALRKGPPRVCVGRTILYNVQSVREWLLSRERQPLASRRHRSFSGVKP